MSYRFTIVLFPAVPFMREYTERNHKWSSQMIRIRL